MVPIAPGEAYVGVGFHRDSASAATLYSITVQRCMRDNRPVATDSASAATFSIKVQHCMHDNRPVAAYRCNGDCSFQGVHVGHVVYYILQTQIIIFGGPWASSCLGGLR